MAALLVTYDLNSIGQNYAGVDKYLEGFARHWRFLRSAWLISTTKSPAQVRDELWRMMDSNDQVFVVDISRDVAAWNGFGTNNDWLKTTIEQG